MLQKLRRYKRVSCFPNPILSCLVFNWNWLKKEPKKKFINTETQNPLDWEIRKIFGVMHDFKTHISIRMSKDELVHVVKLY